ncbi:MAG TPA: PIN domain-containing protein [Candidatus Limnocylindria bacterium]|nr:PIN domain-containing protein [Candidatus Limnocylindria bacterium]
MPKQSYFLDTNILIYALDPRDKVKQSTANTLIRDALRSGRGCISSQVVQEFCNIATGKFKKTTLDLDLESILNTFMRRLLKHTPDIYFYNSAVALHAGHSLSFYDALIVQAAIDLNCAILYSEDLQDGRKYGGLTVKNPFTT